MYVKGFMAAGKPYRENCTVRHSGTIITNRDNSKSEACTRKRGMWWSDICLGSEGPPDNIKYVDDLAQHRLSVEGLLRYTP
jgi:hypothetical protein